MKSLADTSLLRCSKNVLRLEWPACSQRNISVFELSFDDPAFCRRIGEGKAGLTIHCSDYYKPYFLLKAPDEKAILSERVLPLEGAYNFRDLGGYETTDGRYVKWGKLYRSDHLARLTQDDLHYLGSLRLKSNIDYRTLAEAAKQPNCMPEGVTTYRFIPDAASAELAAKAASDADKVAHLLTLAKTNSGVIDGSGLLMLEQYRSFVTSETSLTAYRNMLNLIADPENLPANQHCRGGKDRTGFGAALILTLLGVRKESVFKDFMMTGELRKYRNRQRMAAYRQETSNPQVLAFLSSIMETREAWLAAAFDEIDLRYGSFNRYLTQGLGITPTTIEQIKSLLLAKK